MLTFLIYNLLIVHFLFFLLIFSFHKLVVVVYMHLFFKPVKYKHQFLSRHHHTYVSMLRDAALTIGRDQPNSWRKMRDFMGGF